ncbi:hypothetical protein F5X68DRAFT_60211 [Plectosphaerella plurivora]|uniref:Pal1 cell morphology n=1 Tax=Plectosphaerella plurivora TaxID=936078 RepID=A0A9P9AG56_9PEZI|nr:hypothetical protein F5X68DRAFT_60211 [Plectosphaerella plurivora]
MDKSKNKQYWAQQYLLDPLTAPEPHQEDGPGTSFINPNPLLRTFSARRKTGKEPVIDTTKRQSSLPTPPTSASPDRSSFHPSNPYSPQHRFSSLSPTSEDGKPISPPPNRNPFFRRSTASPPSPLASPSAGISRSASTRQRPTYQDNVGQPDHSAHHRTRSTGGPDQASGLRRNRSINQRYPGDMSHRPLETLAREHRVADRAPHIRARRKVPDTDLIDNLDTVGGTYHHGGPYDATLASRNLSKKYSPLEAVRDSNMEAIRATPREYIQDSLDKHVPLQGTSVIPPGARDLSGKVMEYEEGADLNREPDAKGGPYKRWAGIDYQPDDLKGKGEPSYTFEKEKKEKKALRKSMGPTMVGYEMQSGVNSGVTDSKGPTMVRQRSVSNAADGRPGPSNSLAPPPAEGFSNSTDIRRSNTTGKRFSDGIKRRFGSMRRKKDIDATA